MKNLQLILFTIAFLFCGSVQAQLNWQKGGNNANPPGSTPTLGTSVAYNAPIQFITHGVPRLHINEDIANNGFIGIGTNFTNPQSLLHMNAVNRNWLQFTNNTSGTGPADGFRIGLSGQSGR